MTCVDRITETEFDARVTEIEQEFDISLDDLGIEVTYCTHPTDVDEQMAAIRQTVDEKLKAARARRGRSGLTANEVLSMWEQGYGRSDDGKSWIKKF